MGVLRHADRLTLAAAADAVSGAGAAVTATRWPTSTTPPPRRCRRPVLDAMRHFEAHDRANIHRGVHTLSQRATDAFEQARARSSASSAPVPGTNWCSPRAPPRR
jgi:hypothetical protein